MRLAACPLKWASEIEFATFYQYAVADGIRRLLFRSATGPPPPPDPGQLLLAFAKPPT